MLVKEKEEGSLDLEKNPDATSLKSHIDLGKEIDYSNLVMYPFPTILCIFHSNPYELNIFT